MSKLKMLGACALCLMMGEAYGSHASVSESVVGASSSQDTHGSLRSIFEDELRGAEGRILPPSIFPAIAHQDLLGLSAEQTIKPTEAEMRRDPRRHLVSHTWVEGYAADTLDNYAFNRAIWWIKGQLSYLAHANWSSAQDATQKTLPLTHFLLTFEDQFKVRAAQDALFLIRQYTSLVASSQTQGEVSSRRHLLTGRTWDLAKFPENACERDLAAFLEYALSKRSKRGENPYRSNAGSGDLPRFERFTGYADAKSAAMRAKPECFYLPCKERKPGTITALYETYFNHLSCPLETQEIKDHATQVYTKMSRHTDFDPDDLVAAQLFSILALPETANSEDLLHAFVHLLRARANDTLPGFVRPYAQTFALWCAEKLWQTQKTDSFSRAVPKVHLLAAKLYLERAKEKDAHPDFLTRAQFHQDRMMALLDSVFEPSVVDELAAILSTMWHHCEGSRPWAEAHVETLTKLISDPARLNSFAFHQMKPLVNTFMHLPCVSDVVLAHFTMKESQYSSNKDRDTFLLYLPDGQNLLPEVKERFDTLGRRVLHAMRQEDPSLVLRYGWKKYLPAPDPSLVSAVESLEAAYRTTQNAHLLPLIENARKARDGLL